MKRSTANYLLRLDREFYDRFAAEYSASRAALSPGIHRALGELRGRRSLLDLGCGDGRVGRALATGMIPNEVGRYRGVDFSPRLLERAAFPPSLDYRIIEADLTRWTWPAPAGPAQRSAHPSTAGQRTAAERESPDSFEAAVCFSVLFHIPGPGRRARLLRQLHRCLLPEGRTVLSVWQFLHLARFRRKIVPWSEVGLSPEQVDPGDLLLDWQRGGRGLRYVHHFEEEELRRLCARAGFLVDQQYRSDGESGDLSLFMVLRKPVSASSGLTRRSRCLTESSSAAYPAS